MKRKSFLGLFLVIIVLFTACQKQEPLKKVEVLPDSNATYDGVFNINQDELKEHINSLLPSKYEKVKEFDLYEPEESRESTSELYSTTSSGIHIVVFVQESGYISSISITSSVKQNEILPNEEKQKLEDYRQVFMEIINLELSATELAKISDISQMKNFQDYPYYDGSCTKDHVEAKGSISLNDDDEIFSKSYTFYARAKD